MAELVSDRAVKVTLTADTTEFDAALRSVRKARKKLLRKVGELAAAPIVIRTKRG